LKPRSLRVAGSKQIITWKNGYNWKDARVLAYNRRTYISGKKKKNMGFKSRLCLKVLSHDIDKGSSKHVHYSRNRSKGKES
jgi:hypothetical protein